MSATPGAGISPRLMTITFCWILAIAAAVHYNTPMLEVLAREFGASSAEVGLIPTFTLVGYVAGLVFLGPLGDRFDKRRIILTKLGVIIVALLAAAMAPSLTVLVITGAVIGACTTQTQDMIPLAAELCRPEERGKVLGTLLTAVYLGILLGRVASGFITATFGWRASWLFAALLLAIFFPILWKMLPSSSMRARTGYLQLLRSLVTIYRKYPLLRRQSFGQFVLGLCYGSFWNTLALSMALLYGLGSASTGLMAIPGAAGLIIARPVGRWVDRKGPLPAVTIGTGLVLAAFVLFGFAGVSVALMVAGVVLLDFGIRTSAVANQSLANSFDPAERSRTNLIFATHMFSGNALGAMIGAYTLSHGGWSAVSSTGLGIAFLAFMLALANRRAARIASRTIRP